MTEVPRLDFFNWARVATLNYKNSSLDTKIPKVVSSRARKYQRSTRDTSHTRGAWNADEQHRSWARGAFRGGARLFPRHRSAVGKPAPSAHRSAACAFLWHFLLHECIKCSFHAFSPLPHSGAVGIRRATYCPPVE